MSKRTDTKKDWFIVDPITKKISSKKITQDETSNTTQKKAILYQRVSWDRQAKLKTSEAQRQKNLDRCEKNWVTVVWDFSDEAISWSIINRPWLREAMAFLEKENTNYIKVNYFVCTERSRIARPDYLEEALGTEKEILSTGVDIVTTLEMSGDISTDEWQLMNQMMYILSWYERKKIKKRAMNGRRAKILQGKFCFPQPPVGYKRVRDDNDIYKDILDWENARILRRGLEQFANNTIISKWDLRNYLESEWFKSNSRKSKGIIYNSLPDRILDKSKLYFYAWYIYYPRREIYELIEWQHEPLISFDTIQKIFKKLEVNPVVQRKMREDQNPDFPLSNMITCSCCGRKLSWWYSSKTWKWKKTLYPYYGCTNRFCKERENVPKEKFESDFVALLSDLAVPDFFIIKWMEYIEHQWLHNQWNIAQRSNNLKSQIKDIETRKRVIEDRLVNITSQWLVERLEKERENLDELANQMEEKIGWYYVSDIQKKKALMELEWLLKNPLAFREYGTPELKQLLIWVRFGFQLYYKKSAGYRTHERQGIYWFLEYFRNLHTGI
jgi:site-specific DNA recombinase